MADAGSPGDLRQTGSLLPDAGGSDAKYTVRTMDRYCCRADQRAGNRASNEAGGLGRLTHRVGAETGLCGVFLPALLG